MSYILEALKKSDQERRQGDVPDLQTVHIPIAMESDPARWPYVIIVLLMLSLTFVLGMLRPWETQVTVPDVVQVDKKIEPIALLPARAIVDQPQRMVENHPQSNQTERQLKKAVVVEQSSKSNNPSLDLDSVQHLYDTPPLVQQAIPEMTFAAHVFSSNVEQRSVIINGHSMSEGEVVMDGLKIEQITQNGIVFNYNDQLFRMDVLQDWSFD